MRIDLFKTNHRLPPALATAKRIAEVAGYLNSDLFAEYDSTRPLYGKVTGNSSGKKIVIAWRPSDTMGGYIEFAVNAHGMDKALSNMIKFSDQHDAKQWKGMAETIGNIVIDAIAHGNNSVPVSLESVSTLDDPDIDILTLNKHMNRVRLRDN